jgi:hypothetical protein
LKKNAIVEPISFSGFIGVLDTDDNMVWHSDAGRGGKAIQIAIPLKGPGINYCKLSQEDIKEYFSLESPLHESYDNFKLDEMRAFLNKSCTQDNKNIFKALPYYGLILSAREGVPAIHASPSNVRDRLFIRFNINYAHAKATV